MATYIFTNNRATDTEVCPAGYVPVSIKATTTHGWASISYNTTGKISVYAKTACLLAGGSQSTATKASSVIDSTTGVLVYCPDWVEIYMPNTWVGMYVYSATILLYNETTGEYDETSIVENSSCQYYTDLQRYEKLQYNLQRGAASISGYMGSYNNGIRCKALSSQLYNRKLNQSTASLNVLVDCIWNCDPHFDANGATIGLNIANSVSSYRSDLVKTSAVLTIANAIVSASLFDYGDFHPYLKFKNCTPRNNARFLNQVCFKIMDDDEESRTFLRSYLDLCFAYNYTSNTQVNLGLPFDLYEEYKEQIDAASSGEGRTRTDGLTISYVGSL